MARTQTTDLMAEDDAISPFEGIEDGDDMEGVIPAPGPAEEAEAIVVQAEGVMTEDDADQSDLRPFLDVVWRPRATFRSAHDELWLAGLVILAGAIFLRIAAFVAFSLSAGADVASMLIGAALGFFSPLAFVAFGTAVLVVVDAVGGRPRRLALAFSVALLAVVPLEIKAIVQTAAMVVARRAMHPAGLFGLIAPDAAAPLRSALAGIDIFGAWALALLILAGVVFARPAAQPEDAEAPSE